jgi:hypothetical protein
MQVSENGIRFVWYAAMWGGAATRIGFVWYSRGVGGAERAGLGSFGNSWTRGKNATGPASGRGCPAPFIGEIGFIS